MVKLIHISILILLISSCCPCKKLESTREVNVRDSVRVITQTRIKDSLVFTKAAQATVTVTLPCPDVKPITKKSGNATSTFEIKNGVAKADCYCDSLGIIQRTKETVTNAFKERLKESKTVKVVEVAHYPKWLLILAGIGVLSLGYWAFRFYNFLKLK